MEFVQSTEFRKDLKRLGKKWRSLPEDLRAACAQISDLYGSEENVAEYRGAFFNGKRATILYTNSLVEVVKMRLDVEAIGRNDRARIVFVAVRTGNHITFVELYAKNDKDREDPARYNKLI